jgi:hypothetical protein
VGSVQRITVIPPPHCDGLSVYNGIIEADHPIDGYN